ncbi:uncharacterized protein [Malus domestica]|uniref:uncharacterized protein n=1 Tax=Malus domestica TaxID=3750 RepID=UPI0039763A76
MGDSKETKSSSRSSMSEGTKYDPNHPFYLHHSDQPGVSLVTQPLRENNYSTWSLSMTMALQAKNKMGFVDGSIKKPAEGSQEDMQQWGRCNVLVKTWLLSSIFKEISASVIYCELASQMGAELK